MKFLALHAIRLYQRFISPYKGFRCAYAALSGHGSCSALAYRAIRRYGVWVGLELLDQRLHKCLLVAQRRAPRAQHGPLARQAGSVSCDLPCDASDACDVLECASECTSWRKKRRDRHLVIPPRTSGPSRANPRYPPDRS